MTKINYAKVAEQLARFADDPVALAAIHKAIDKEYKALLKKYQKDMSDERATDLKNFQGTFQRHITKSIQDVVAPLQAKIEILSRPKPVVVDNTHEKNEKKIKYLEERLDKALKRLDRDLENHSNRLEVIGSAMGAPNRSLYINGTLPSPYFSDTNLVAGTNIVLTPVTDFVHGTANVIISASGTGGGVNIAGQVVTSTASGSNVTIDTAQTVHLLLTTLEVYRNGQSLQPNGNAGLPGSSWSQASTIINVYNADPSDVYMLLYTY